MDCFALLCMNTGSALCVRLHCRLYHVTMLVVEEAKNKIFPVVSVHTARWVFCLVVVFLRKRRITQVPTPSSIEILFVMSRVRQFAESNNSESDAQCRLTLRARKQNTSTCILLQTQVYRYSLWYWCRRNYISFRVTENTLKGIRSRARDKHFHA